MGTSGWEYGDWQELYGKGSLKREEMVSGYFQHFDLLELSSTYLNRPDPEEIELVGDRAHSMGNKEVSVKLPRKASYDLAMEEGPGPMRDVLFDFSRIALQPLEDAGVLSTTVFQSSHNFYLRGDITYPTKRNIDEPLPRYDLGIRRLEEILEILGDLPGRPVIELRNSSWISEDISLLKEARDLLIRYGCTLAVVDGPSFPWIVETVTPDHYVRFLGRNRKNWFKGMRGESISRYDYSYTGSELMERAVSIRELLPVTLNRIRVVFCNYPGAQAVRNALDMKDMLSHVSF